jgi:hypothetical protein
MEGGMSLAQDIRDRDALERAIRRIPDAAQAAVIRCPCGEAEQALVRAEAKGCGVITIGTMPAHLDKP